MHACAARLEQSTAGVGVYSSNLQTLTLQPQGGQACLPTAFKLMSKGKVRRGGISNLWSTEHPEVRPK